MSRPLRIEYPGAYYHVMNRGRGRQRIYRSPRDYQRFINLLSETCAMWGVRVHAYSLMPNHYHMVMETPGGNVSRAMRHLDGVYTQRYNREYKTDGTLFRGRYKALLIEKDGYLLQVVRYIHLNPVEGKLVRDAREHRWTSHRYYVGKEGSPPGLEVGEVLGQFHARRRAAMGLYVRFMREGIDEGTRKLYGRGNWPSMWGSERFKERIRKRLEREIKDYEIPQGKRERVSPTLRLIEEEVSKSYGMEVRELMGKRRGYWNEARNVAIYLGRKVGGYRLIELGQRWGGLKYSSVSGIVYGVEKRLAEYGKLRKRLEEIEKHILNRQT